MAEGCWTPSLIEERFVEAADVMKRLPDIRVPGHYNTWPTILREFADLVGQEPSRLRRPPPAPDAISRMEEALEWLKWLQPIDARIVWLRANGERWKAVCHQVGLARAAAHEHWVYALCVVAWKLNGRRLGAGISRRRVIEQARRLSVQTEGHAA